MSQNDFEARIWRREQKPDQNGRLLAKDVTSLGGISELLGISVSTDMLKDRRFRRKYDITMSSNIRDKDGGIVREGDIVAYGSRHNSANFYAVRYGFFGIDNEPLFTLHRVGETKNWSEGTAMNCIRIASYYDNPDTHAHLFQTHYNQP